MTVLVVSVLPFQRFTVFSFTVLPFYVSFQFYRFTVLKVHDRLSKLYVKQRFAKNVNKVKMVTPFSLPLSGPVN